MFNLVLTCLGFCKFLRCTVIGGIDQAPVCLNCPLGRLGDLDSFRTDPDSCLRSQPERPLLEVPSLNPVLCFTCSVTIQEWGSEMNVRDVMTSEVVSLSSEAEVDEALELLLEKSISGLPLVDPDDRLMGLITEFDLLKLYSDEDYWDDSPCSKYMTTNVCTVQADASLDVAANVFNAARIRRLPVLDGDKLVGILSRRDILREILKRRVQPSC